MSLPNTWYLRRVADTAARACYICYKPSSSVLITPDNKDFFYVCPVHLKDRNFCSPIIDSEEEARKAKEEAMAKEIETVKKEYEEKQLKKKEKEKDKKSKDEEDSKEKNKANEEQNKKSEKDQEKEKNDKIDSIKKSGTASKADEGPRIFSLHKNFYQMRVDRLRNIEAAKRNRERLKDPSLFPSVPSGGL
ncbi:hypothetical protein PHISCL_07562 [Aspergillus sclerotialis]|uniref:DUF1742-domain-containing protein n=1 Tax=Aspergillus sclerotialis TaxID=2070753 RepID=A0A3A2ZBW3_9EURO|nr:hypothetical protein PHISCL_07562 [Aspergillus sclerotialis]